MAATFFPDSGGFRRWLAAHGAANDELLVGFYKRGSGRPSLTWPESVDEALCAGWIDGVRRRVDDESYTIRFTPRRARSIWSAVNIARVAALTEAGRMQPAGAAAFARREEARSAIYAYEQPEAAAFDAEAQGKFARCPGAWEFFVAQAPWYRQVATHWALSAKRPETREKRLATLIADSASGVRLKQLRRAVDDPAKIPG